MTHQKKFLKDCTGLQHTICDLSRMGSVLFFPIVLLFSLQAFGTNIPLENSSFCTSSFFSSSPEEMVAYCDAGVGPNGSGSAKISNVTIADIDNDNFGTVGYQDFTAISTDLEREGTYTFSWMLSYPDNDYETIVWIDYNQDMDFDDPGEQVLFHADQAFPHSDDVTIPATATLGSTRMRVRLNYTLLGPNSTPCGDSYGGQVEDYTVNIVACSEPIAANTLANITPPICSGSPFTLSISESQAQTVSYQWQSSPDNVTWTDVSGATDSTLNISTQSADTWYRCTLSNCGTTIYSTAIEIASVPPPNPGNTMANASPPICSGTGFTVAIENYGIPGITFQWQYSLNNSNWISIPGATNEAYVVSPITTTTWYRCKATNCQGTVYSVPLEMTVVTCYCSASGLTGPGEKISNVTFSNINNSSSGSAGYEDFTAVTTDIEQGGIYAFSTTISNPISSDQVIVWIDFNQDADFDDPGEQVFQSAVGGPYSAVLYLPYTVPTGNTRMRIRLHKTGSGSNNTPCGSSSRGQVEDYTVNVVGCTINAPGNTLSDVPPPICNQSFTLSMANVIPAALYQWQSSPDNVTWTDITGATNVTHVVSSISSTTWYRCRVTNCDDIVNSNPLEMTVQALQEPGSTVSSVSPPICPITSFTLSLSNSLSGVSYQWQYSPDNTTYTNLGGATNNSHYVAYISSTRWYRCRVTECGVDTYTTPLEMVLKPLPDPGSTVSSVPSPVCPGSSFTLSLSNSLSGVAYQWQSSPDNSTWTDIVGATNTTYDVASISSTTWYRCQVNDVSCIPVYSSSLEMDFIPPPAASNTNSGVSPPLCAGAGFTLTLSTTYSGVTYQWQSSPDNSTWTDMAGKIYSTLTYNAIPPSTWFRCKIENSCGSIVYSTAYYMSIISCYCPAGANNPFSEKISNITLNTINNNSSSTAGYEDFTGLSTDLDLGGTYAMSGTISGPTADYEVLVWIDFNQDLDFEDPGEQLLQIPVSGGVFNQNITIPGTALAGTTRMRVRLHNTQISPNPTPCYPAGYGQVEDYNVSVIVATPPKKIWIGGTDSWDVATNWNPNGVPTSTDEVSVSAGVLNIPASHNALAKQVLIETGAELNIISGASLTITGGGNDGMIIKDNNSKLNNFGTISIEGSCDKGMLCQLGGQITNYGAINIPTGTTLTTRGIEVDGSGSLFSNVSGATVSIQKTGTNNTGIHCDNNAAVINHGLIDIGTEIGSSVGIGIWIDHFASFTNENTGILNIQKVTLHGILAQINAILDNNGIVNIGTSTDAMIGSIGLGGLNAGAVINNFADGIISIDVAFLGVMISIDVDFNNYGTLNIGTGANASITGRGISCFSSLTLFTNYSSGTVNIGNCGADDSAIEIVSAGNFENQGNLNIGTNAGAFIGGRALRCYHSGSSFINTASGTVHLARSGDGGNFSAIDVFSGGYIKNDGAMSIGMGSNGNINGHGIIASAVFDNYGSIEIDHCALNLITGSGSAGVVNQSGGMLKGDGLITSNQLTFAGGELRPGYSPGKMTFDADEDFSSSAIEIEVEGITTAGVDYDQIVVNGVATLGGTLNLVINYLSPSNGDQITILDATSLSGTFSTINGLSAGWSIAYDFPNAGEVTLAFGALPIELLSFSGKAMDNYNLLEWATASEQNVSQHVIERSLDGRDFNEIGHLEAMGNSNVEIHYHFMDENPAPISYYRLRSVDFDGSSSVSNIISIKREGADSYGIVNLYPVPARGKIFVAYSTPGEEAVQFTLTDITGKILRLWDVHPDEGVNMETIGLNEWPSGVYFLTFSNGFLNETRRVLKE